MTRDKIEAYILKNYLKKSQRNLAKKCGVTRSSVYYFMKKNKLIVPKEIQKQFRSEASSKKISFTPVETKFIKNNYLTLTIREIARAIGKTNSGVRWRMMRLNLVVPTEIIKQRKLDNQFKPGHIPFTKGLKQTEFMSLETIERTKATRFQPGQKSHNLMEVNTITTRFHKNRKHDGGYYYQHICVAYNTWELLHYHIWAKANGPIPEGFVLRYKDGNTMNCVLENLELISQEENMTRNSIHQYPDDVKQSMRLLGKLNRTISKLNQNG